MTHILTFEKELRNINFSTVHNLPLFTHQVQLSLIPTNFPACTSAICWQNLKIRSFPATFQEVSSFLVIYRLFKGVS